MAVIRKAFLTTLVIVTSITILVYLSSSAKTWQHSQTTGTSSIIKSQGVIIIPPSQPPRRFVLAVFYWEKMTMGVNNLLSLLRFARCWKAEVPIPFLKKAELSGLPPGQDITTFDGSYGDDNFSLDLLFNLDGFRGSPPKHSDLARLIDYREFIEGLQYQYWIIYVTIFYDRDYTDHGRKARCSFFRKYWSNPYFPGIRISCCAVHATIPTVPNDIAAVCGFKNLSSFVIIFEVWRGTTHPDPNRKFRLFVPVAFLHNYTSPSAALPHSQYVIGNATQFIKKTTGNDGAKFIAVHIRTEKLQINSQDGRINDTKCVLDTIRKVQEMSRNYSISRVLYFTDYVGFQNRKYADLMTAHNATRTAYDPLLYHGANNDAFIAQIELLVMSRATRLVVCGGGSFQSMIVWKYKKRSPYPPVRIHGCG